ncbi:hypothetical protein ABFX02_14G140000 [Erythranthe guttata]
MAQILVFPMVLLMLMFSPSSYAQCAYEAIFNLGDSNFDAGGFYPAFPSPNGMTYFSKPTGRTTDGRQHPLYCSKTRPYSTRPFYLAVQINQMKQFKATVEESKSHGNNNYIHI